MNLRQKLMAALFAVGIIPLLMMGSHGQMYGHKIVDQQTTEKLTGLLQQRKQELNQLFFNTETVLNVIGSLIEQYKINISLERHEVAGGHDELSQGEGQGISFDEFESEYDDYLIDAITEFGYDDLMIVLPSGFVEYTANKGEEYHTNLYQGTLASSHLARAVKEALQQNRYLVTDLEPYAAHNGLPALVSQRLIK